MKYHVFTCDDGSKWAVPAEVIAQHYANDRECEEPGCFDATYNLMMDCFKSGDFGFGDWARSNLDWDDIAADAIKVGSSISPHFSKCWKKDIGLYADLEKTGGEIK